MGTERDMGLLFLIAATFCAGVATILGFHWFGTDGADWTGWIAAAVLLYLVSLLVGSNWPRWTHRTQ